MGRTPNSNCHQAPGKPTEQDCHTAKGKLQAARVLESNLRIPRANVNMQSRNSRSSAELASLRFGPAVFAVKSCQLRWVVNGLCSDCANWNMSRPVRWLVAGLHLTRIVHSEVAQISNCHSVSWRNPVKIPTRSASEADRVEFHHSSQVISSLALRVGVMAKCAPSLIRTGLDRVHTANGTGTDPVCCTSF
jgi:hypothetical protein